MLLSDGRYESPNRKPVVQVFEARIRSPSDLLPDLTRESIENRFVPGTTQKPRLGIEAQHLTLAVVPEAD